MNFIALFRSDQVPPDPNGLVRMPIGDSTERVKIFGKSRQAAFRWIDHKSLQSNGAVEGPVSLDGRSWLIGRVRLDASAALRSAFPKRSCEKEPHTVLCL